MGVRSCIFIRCIYDRGSYMKKIMLVFGTRPEAIKMCPLVKELRKRKQFEVVVCVTGQHKEMLKQVLDIFEITPEYDLHIMSKNQTLEGITIKILESIGTVLDKEKPDLVLVHGDTSTSFVAALACFYRQIAVGHVEAGLRTNDIYSPFPEEFNREAISLISKVNFAPTELAKENLIKEGKNPSSIYVTGNTGIDAMKTTLACNYDDEDLKWASGSKLILLTAHRRENLGEPMGHMFKAIRKIVDEFDDVKVIYPIHMNPKIKEIADVAFDGCDRVRMIKPLDVVSFHHYMKRSYMILTDSGGIQEEAAAIDKPVLVMREKTERMEGVEAGVLKLVGTDEKVIYDNMKQLLEDKQEYELMSHAKNPYGDGNASIYIADILEKIV